MSVDIASILAEPVDPLVVQIVRITGRADGGSATPARVHVSHIEGYATGGPAPDPARVQIAGLHGFARDPAPLAGQSLLHQWDGARLVQVTPMVWNGTGLEAS